MARVYTVNNDATTVPWQPFRCRDEAKELQDLLERDYDLISKKGTF